MTDPFWTYLRMISGDTSPATSSRESADGPTPCGSPDGPTTGPSGPEARLASRSAPQDSAALAMTIDTSPPRFSDWSGPAAPRCCLASKSPARQSSEGLQAALNEALPGRLSGHGPTIYRLTWKPHTTPSGRPICRLRASAPRTSDSDSSSVPSASMSPEDQVKLAGWATTTTCDGQGAANPGAVKSWASRGHNLPEQAQIAGWPTASSRDWKDTPGMATEAQNPDGSARDRTDQLPRKAMLAGWTTPDAALMNVSADPVKHQERRSRLREKHGNGNGAGLPIGQMVHLAGWPTPMAGNPGKPGQYNPAGNTDSSRKTVELAGRPETPTPDGPMRLTTHGEMLTGFSAGMESGGRLNPRFSGWLQGYPREWCEAALSAAQHIPSRKGRKRG